MNDTIYPGLVIGEPIVTPRPNDQVNQPIDDIISPDEVQIARPM